MYIYITKIGDCFAFAFLNRKNVFKWKGLKSQGPLSNELMKAGAVSWVLQSDQSWGIGGCIGAISQGWMWVGGWWFLGNLYVLVLKFNLQCLLFASFFSQQKVAWCYREHLIKSSWIKLINKKALKLPLVKLLVTGKLTFCLLIYR